MEGEDGIFLSDILNREDAHVAGLDEVKSRGKKIGSIQLGLVEVCGPIFNFTKSK